MAVKRTKCRMACGRDARKPDTLCEPCWRKAGKPSTAEVAERKALERLRSEGLAPVPRGGLTDERVEDGEAMQWVWDGRPIQTRQQKGFADLLEADGRSKFWDRMQKLKGQVVDGIATTEVVSWDGVGPCPTCKAERESADAVEGLIQELLGKTLEGV